MFYISDFIFFPCFPLFIIKKRLFLSCKNHKITTLLISLLDQPSLPTTMLSKHIKQIEELFSLVSIILNTRNREKYLIPQFTFIDV